MPGSALTGAAEELPTSDVREAGWTTSLRGVRGAAKAGYTSRGQGGAGRTTSFPRSGAAEMGYLTPEVRGAAKQAAPHLRSGGGGTNYLIPGESGRRRDRTTSTPEVRETAERSFTHI